MIDLDALERLAREATSGEWFVGDVNGLDNEHFMVRCESPIGPRVANCLGAFRGKQARINTAYIAACDPPTIQELIRLARIGQEREGK